MVKSDTPLWRHGPKDKPVLCNACGSRYRHAGHLENYTPSHFRPEYLHNLQNLKNPSSCCIATSVGKYSSLWGFKIPSRKRSKRKSPMQRFQEDLLNLYISENPKPEESSQEGVLIEQNMNNYIPSNEIGLGVIRLKPNDTSK
ncbi:uncharacterized protein LOC130713384 [Lotus japonicus]|uniref:uncharacterized protein LOC130713384 n=1 Tax=Lotus japonicus TaxID=34305 RepID=UPI00258B4EB1|nr:uncharacterized protein LOC130713384 [Lotus japonicus]